MNEYGAMARASGRARVFAKLKTCPQLLPIQGFGQKHRIGDEVAGGGEGGAGSVAAPEIRDYLFDLRNHFVD